MGSHRKKTVSKRGLGRLYKRAADGKEYPSGSKVQGYYYLEFRVDGKRTRHRLTNAQGEPISILDEAEEERRKVLAPYLNSTKEEQLKAIIAKLDDLDSQRQQALEANRPALQLSRIWTEYQASQNRPKSGPRTLVRYMTCIMSFNQWMQAAYPEIANMRDVNLEHTEAYANHLESRNLSPSTFNIYLNSLSTVWATLATKAGISENPFAWDNSTRTGIQRKNIKAEATIRKKRALTLAEVNAVIDQAEGDYRTLLIILVCTGQRLVDGVKLQWRDIDLHAGIITLIPQKTATRTGKQVFVPILPQLRAELESKDRFGRYVLPDLVVAYDRDRSAVTKKIRKIFKAAGLNAHKETGLRTGQAIVETGAHSLRHSFVSIARIAGIPDVIIQTITGHESVEMVDHYTSVSAETVKALSAAMPSALNAPNKLLDKGQPPPPLPDWVRGKIESMTAENWQEIKLRLLATA